jgi:hypothetical protein
MAKKKKAGRQWTWAPDRRQEPSVPDDLKSEVKTLADELVEKVLKPAYIKPPPEEPRWNYPIDIWTKRHQSFFYFCSTYSIRAKPTSKVGEMAKSSASRAPSLARRDCPHGIDRPSRHRSPLQRHRCRSRSCLLILVDFSGRRPIRRECSGAERSRGSVAQGFECPSRPPPRKQTGLQETSAAGIAVPSSTANGN